MTTVTLDGTPVKTSGELPLVGSAAPNFKLTATDLSSKTLDDFKGKNVILNIFPSVETGVCSMSVRNFNREAAELDNTVVICISKDLPFTLKNFCAAEGIENVITLSDYKDESFNNAYRTKFLDGIFEGLHSRAVVVMDQDHIIKYTEQVPETGEEPNYKDPLYALLDE